MNVNAVEDIKRQKSFFERYEFHGSNLSELTSIPQLKEWLAWIENKKNVKSTTLNTASYFLSKIPTSATILDFGCGDGWAMMYILRLKPKAYVIGIDVTPKLIKEALQNAKELGVKDKCDFIICDCTQMPFCNEVFDATVDLNVIHHLSRIRDGLINIYRTMKIGGQTLVVEVVTNNLLVPVGRRLRTFLKFDISSGSEIGFTSNQMAVNLNSVGFKIVRKNHDDYILESLMKLAVRYPKITGIFPKPLLSVLVYLELALQRVPVLQQSGGQALFLCRR